MVGGGLHGHAAANPNVDSLANATGDERSYSVSKADCNAKAIAETVSSAHRHAGRDAFGQAYHGTVTSGIALSEADIRIERRVAGNATNSAGRRSHRGRRRQWVGPFRDRGRDNQ